MTMKCENANMELVYQIFDGQGNRHGMFPMDSDMSLTSLVAKSPFKSNETSSVLAVSIFSPDDKIFKQMHPISLAWKPPPTFSYDSLPKELNVHLIHRGTGYEVQAKILTNSRGVQRF